MKRKSLLCFVFAIIMFLVPGCQKIIEVSVGAVEEADINHSEAGSMQQYEITHNDYSTEETAAIAIDLNNLNEGMEDVYTYDGQHLTICHAGEYIINGKTDNGNIRINVFDDEIVHLFLDNVEIRSDEGSAIRVENAAKVIITAKAGTENILSDESKREGTQKACIFSNSDLTINGSGKLYVYGYYTDGVRSKDLLRIVNTNLYVKTKEDGIRGNDGVILYDSMTEVECEGTGIISNSDKDMVILQGGSCKVIAGKNAIAANRYVAIHDSQLDLYSVLEIVKCNGIQEIDEVLE